MQNYESIYMSMESISNLIFESIRHVRDEKKEPTYQQSFKYRFKNEENKTINEST